MKIIRVLGSQRKNSISTGIVNYMSQPLKNEKIVTFNLGNFKGCIACQKCKENKSTCVISDGLKDYFKALEDPCVLLLSAPNYMGDLSGQVKQFIDRHYSLSFTQKLMIKKCYLVIAQGYTDLSYYQETYEKVANILSHQFKAPVEIIVHSQEDWKDDQAFICKLDRIKKAIEKEDVK
jgi:multimeric flavodoxin WrbA